MEEKPTEAEEIQDTSEVEVEQSHFTTPPRWREKLKLHKWKILGGVLGVLVVAGAIFGAYKLSQRQVQPTLLPTPTPIIEATPTLDPTADWETYTNTEYEYSIKYPEGTKIHLDYYPLVIFLINAKLGLTHLPIGEQTLEEGLRIMIVVESSEGKTAKELLSRHVDVSKFEDEIFTQQIGGIETYSIKFQFPDWNQYTEVVKGEKLYEFQIQTKGDNQEVDLELANLMLSTFSFLE